MADQKIRIVSDGTPAGTKLLVDGVPLQNVVSISWYLDAGGRDVARADVQLLVDEVDLTAELHAEAVTTDG